MTLGEVVSKPQTPEMGAPAEAEAAAPGFGLSRARDDAADASPAARPDPPDEVLLARLRDGQVSAGEELVRRHYPALSRYLQRLTGSDLVAEDLHQQAWLSALEHVGRFDPATAGGGFKAWLFRIATNKANDHWRTSGRERVAKLGLKHIAAGDARPAADHRMEADDQERKLRWAIAQLPEAQRQVLLLRYYSGLKFVDIAEVMGCPLNTALGRMHKAMLKLRELMA